jgi:accessory gene regulator B
MFLIERISKTLAGQISSNLKLNEDQKQIITYGAFAFIQTVWSFLLVIVLAAMFNVLIESIIVLFSISFLRKYSGGVHSASPNRCAIIGAIISVGFALFARKIISVENTYEAILVGVVCFAYAYYIVNKLAPVDSPAKPIVKEEKRKRLKKRAIQVLHSYLIISVSAIILSYRLKDTSLLVVSACIYIGTAWQAFMLTYRGHVVMGRVDTFLRNISS